MRERQLKLSLLKDMYAICVYPHIASIPEWALMTPLCSITRTEKELTIVCPQSVVPAGSECDKNWRCFRIDGSFDFNQIGIISSLATPLAKGSISIFVVSTYDTDYILVKEEKVEHAITVLTNDGHLITRES